MEGFYHGFYYHTLEEGFILHAEKAKVVAAFWGTEFTQFLAALAILHQDDMKKRPKLAQQGIEQMFSLNSSDDLCLLIYIQLKSYPEKCGGFDCRDLK